MKTWVTGELITAEELNRVEQRVDDLVERAGQVEEVVDRIKLANQSAGEGAPTGDAPEGWVYTDLTTGDIYRMEA